MAATPTDSPGPGLTPWNQLTPAEQQAFSIPKTNGLWSAYPSHYQTQVAPAVPTSTPIPAPTTPSATAPPVNPLVGATPYTSPLPNYNLNAPPPGNALAATTPTQFNQNPLVPGQVGGQGTAQQNQYTSPLGMYGPAGGTGFYQS